MYEISLNALPRSLLLKLLSWCNVDMLLVLRRVNKQMRFQIDLTPQTEFTIRGTKGRILFFNQAKREFFLLNGNTTEVWPVPPIVLPIFRERIEMPKQYQQFAAAMRERVQSGEGVELNVLNRGFTVRNLCYDYQKNIVCALRGFGIMTFANTQNYLDDTKELTYIFGDVVALAIDVEKNIWYHFKNTNGSVCLISYDTNKRKVTPMEFPVDRLSGTIICMAMHTRRECLYIGYKDSSIVDEFNLRTNAFRQIRGGTYRCKAFPTKGLFVDEKTNLLFINCENGVIRCLRLPEEEM